MYPEKNMDLEQEEKKIISISENQKLIESTKAQEDLNFKEKNDLKKSRKLFLNLIDVHGTIKSCSTMTKQRNMKALTELPWIRNSMKAR